MLSIIDNLIWGDGTLLLILLGGVIFSFRTKWVQFRFLKDSVFLPFKNKEKSKGISSFAALATSLAGTMGVGNIVGVGAALAIGGPGSIFWMWISAFLCMGIKYSEIFLAVRYKDKNAVGALGYIKNGLKLPRLSVIFGVITVLCSLGIGNCVQMCAVKDSLNELHIGNSQLIAIAILIPFAIIILKGNKSVSSSAEKIIPIISIVYILGCLGIILINIAVFPNIIATIFKSAMGYNSVIGGTFGYSLKECIRVGVSQGIFSNESGMGSSCIVMSMTDEADPHKQGLWGIFEVFFDTVVVCSLTAFAVLCSPADISSALPSAVTLEAFGSSYGLFGKYFMAVSIAVFAMATLICWSFYGAQSLRCIFKNDKIIFIYRVLFILIATVSVFFDFTTLYKLADILNGIMLLVNVPVIISLNNRLVIDRKEGV